MNIDGFLESRIAVRIEDETSENIQRLIDYIEPYSSILAAAYRNRMSPASFINTIYEMNGMFQYIIAVERPDTIWISACVDDYFEREENSHMQILSIDEFVSDGTNIQQYLEGFDSIFE